ncbi:MAG: glycoside hydrolase family 9 protein [Bacteroidales bacterium]|nr:glycoside hydrolase family 9 protein [Bacteroidales bacterium]
MSKRTHYNRYPAICILALITGCTQNVSEQGWTVNDQEYLEKTGLSVLAFHNYYPVGKQGGIEIIQHGERIATNGFIRMQQVEGKRFSDPERAVREVDKENKVIKANVRYDDFDFKYTVRIWPDGDKFRLAVDLDKPIPESWTGKLSFDLEFYPPLYYGKTFQLDELFGIIPRQGNGPMIRDEAGNLRSANMGQGRVLTLAGEDPLRKVVIEGQNSDLVLIDGRNTSKQGWIIVRSVIPGGVTASAIEWTIEPEIVPGWKREPVIAVSQIGYHPGQKKQAVIELDRRVSRLEKASLVKITGKNSNSEILSMIPEKWGKFLCYNYAVFDFSSVTDPGMYMVQYGGKSSFPFAIDSNIYKAGVWQPALEGYFPIQMCHIKVRDRMAIWHGACHLDDALQAPLDIVHIDGYRQYKEAETNYKPLTTVPFLNTGGWHDAGDDDLAAGSQAATTQFLVLASEILGDGFDQTYVNWDDLYVEMHRPDGVPDFVQQIKHGVLNLLSGYRAAGHSFAGIIANREGRNITGDWASQTDQLFYDQRMNPKQKNMTHSGVMDDRWVFTSKDTGLEYLVSAALASASRSLKDFDPRLASECLETARKVWDYEQTSEPVQKPAGYVPRNTKLQEIISTGELLITTGEEKYATHMISLLPAIQANIGRAAWCVARAGDRLKDEAFNNAFRNALQTYKTRLDSTLSANPFGVPWRPAIWGIGWDIQNYALEHYYLIQEYPDLFSPELLYRVVNYVLGCHPGSGTSLVSGVGAHSITNAFGVYRHLESYIPGGMVSGTALIRPDFPELKETTPFLWQQSEYVMPGAASYIFCVRAAEKLLNMK